MKNKLIILSLFISIFLSLLIGFYGHYVYKEKFLASTQKSLEQKTELLGLNFINELNAITRDLTVISATPPIKGIIRSSRNLGVDPSDNSTLQFWKDRLQVIFAAFIETNNTITQIRYIRADGDEIVRVDQKNNKTIIVGEKKLQNKSKEPYFVMWKKLNFPSLYISKVTPNKENGVIEYPLYLTIRVMQKVSAYGDPFGVLVINLDYVAFIKEILKSLYKGGVLKSQDSISLLNDTGDYFSYHDKKFVSSFDGINNKTTDRFDSYFKEIKQSKKDSGFIFYADKTVYFYKLYFDKSVKNRYIYLINENKVMPFFDLSSSSTQRVLLLSSIVFISSFFIIILLINRIFKPLYELAAAVSESTASNHPLKFRYKAPYEINILKQAILDKEKKLLEISTYDNLTGALNRHQFIHKLYLAIKNSSVINEWITVFFIDIDDFKHINDMWGHQTGDAVLREVYKRLSKVTSQFGFIGRLGGDEFVVVHTDLQTIDDINLQAEKYQYALSETLSFKNGVIKVYLSIGIAIYPENTKSPSELLKYADYSMYQVKSKGKNSYMIFSDDLKQQFIRKNKIEVELQDIINSNSIDIYYQPQFFTKSKEMYGVEALIRWPKDNILYPVSPEECVAVAEQSSLIIPLGYQILERAMIDHMQLVDKIGGDMINLSVNLCSIQLRERDFLARLQSIIVKTNFPREYLTLEITEQKLLTNFRHEQETLHRIRDSGIGLALDDFGTGYASLKYIRDIPFSVLKIDKSIIDSIEKHDEKSINIIKFTIQFSKTLNMKVVAEGVEEEPEMMFLIDNDCDVIQGYYFDKALSIDELISKYGMQHNDSSQE
ncbi:MAG: EAL domain-containing protein [Legionellaceae bacterium]|nr:EAL domain-containing protein [Legionellaceae bacterium]